MVVGQETPVSSAGGGLVGFGLATIVHELTVATVGATSYAMSGLANRSATIEPIAINRPRPGVRIHINRPMGSG